MSRLVGSDRVAYRSSTDRVSPQDACSNSGYQLPIEETPHDRRSLRLSSYMFCQALLDVRLRIIARLTRAHPTSGKAIHDR